MRELLLKAKGKFDWHIDPLQLGTQFMKALDVRDLPIMLIDLREDDWRSFFKQEAAALSPDIFE